MQHPLFLLTFFFNLEFKQTGIKDTKTYAVYCYQYEVIIYILGTIQFWRTCKVSKKNRIHGCEVNLSVETGRVCLQWWRWRLTCLQGWHPSLRAQFSELWKLLEGQPQTLVAALQNLPGLKRRMEQPLETVSYSNPPPR